MMFPMNSSDYLFDLTLIHIYKIRYLISTVKYVFAKEFKNSTVEVMNSLTAINVPSICKVDCDMSKNE